MNVSQTAAQPAWWSQSSSSGERDLKEDMLEPAKAASAADDGGWGADGFGFDDFVDIINPLQHLPFVSTLYREFTGDTIAPAARAAGGALYGGPAGLVAGVANVMFEAESGSDIGATMIAELRGDGAAPAASAVPAETSVLAEAPQPSTPAPAPAPANSGAITPAAGQRSFAVPGVQTAAKDAGMTPEAMAAYAKASALTAPTPGSGSVDWTSGVITQPAAESAPEDPSLRNSRHARLFDLFRSETLPDEEDSAGRRADGLTPEETRRIQARAIASLNPETPSRRRIFRNCRTGTRAASRSPPW